MPRNILIATLSALVVLPFLASLPQLPVPRADLNRAAILVQMQNRASHRRLVVIGSGLAGLSAALEASREASTLQVVVLEKNPQVGGNSARASSGVNAVHPESGDSVDLYKNDTLKSGGGLSKPELVDRLASSSQDMLHWLTSLGVDLSVVVRLGGHSAPRTYSNKVGPNVGFVLVRALEQAVGQQPNVRIISRAKVMSVAYSGDGRVSVTYSQGPDGDTGQGEAMVALMADGVVFASGGFAASREMLSRFCPEVAGLPTTNGPWATGDGVALAGALGARMIHMDHVQVHPTGLVDPRDPNSSSKFLGPEKLRGCGAVLIGRDGRRFVDELSTRDVVAGALMGQPGHAAWLLLGADGAALFGEGTLGFYASKGLVAKVDDVTTAAHHMGVDAQVLNDEITQYDTFARVSAEGNPTAAARDKFGKRFFPTQVGSGTLWVALVTPVVHYTMGGMEINGDAVVLGTDGEPLPGIWAAGEASGGLHGRNRLGGNSLAETLVFGRIAGASAARYLANSEVKAEGVAASL